MKEDNNKKKEPKTIKKINGKGGKKSDKSKKQPKELGGKYQVNPLEKGYDEKEEKKPVHEHYKGKMDGAELERKNGIKFEANPPKQYKGKHEAGAVAKDVYKGKYSSSEEEKPPTHDKGGSSFETYNGKYADDIPEEKKEEKTIRGIKKLPVLSEKEKKKAEKKKQAEMKKAEKEKAEKEKTEKKQKSGKKTEKKAKMPDSAPKKRKRKKKRAKTAGLDFLVKLVSVSASLFITGAMILNMPIIKDSDEGNMSIVNFVKSYQPLVHIEGELKKTDMDLQIDTKIVDVDFSDGLDLPQLIEGQYTVLFLGFDEYEFNTDVIWVCQFDIGNCALNILQIPRDTCLPDYTDSPTGKFNSIYSQGPRYVNPPIQRVVNAVQENFGIPVDAYITTGCDDIADMVDLVGGIPITLDEEIIYEADKRIPAGKTVLSGEQAEWFVRFRWALAEGDIGRMKNQRRFMAAAMEKLFSIVNDEGRVKLYSYLKTVYDNEYIYTNMSLGDVGMLADFASTLSMDKVRVNMVPGEGASYQAPDGQVYDIYSVHKLATLNMLNNYFRPYQNIMTSSDSSIVEYITDYMNTAYDDTSDTLQGISDGEADNSGLIFKGY